MCWIFVSLFFLVSFIFPFFFFSSFLPALLFVSFILCIYSVLCVWSPFRAQCLGHTYLNPPSCSLISMGGTGGKHLKMSPPFLSRGCWCWSDQCQQWTQVLLPPSSRLALKWMPLSSLCTDSAVCLQLSEPFMNTLCLYIFFTLRTVRTELLMGSAQQLRHHSSVSKNISLDLRPDMAVPRGTFFQFLSCVTVNIRMHQSTG